MGVSFITTDGGEELAILPRAEYEALVDAADEAEDVADLERRRGEPAMAQNLVLAILEGRMSALEAWRRERGMTQAELARAAGVRTATISDLESGRSKGRFDVMRRIAKALGIKLDDLDYDGPVATG